jgi:hypothetical protein
MRGGLKNKAVAGREPLPIPSPNRYGFFGIVSGGVSDG